MPNVLRHKGKFIKKKVLESRLKSIAAMNRARRKSAETNTTNNEVQQVADTILLEGRRIIELGVLAENLKCFECKKTLSLLNTVEEDQCGLHSILSVRCDDCSVITKVPTGKMHFKRNQPKHNDINKRAVLGTIRGGSDCNGLNQILTCLNVPTLSKDLFEEYEREMNPVLEPSKKEDSPIDSEEERRIAFFYSLKMKQK